MQAGFEIQTLKRKNVKSLTINASQPRSPVLSTSNVQISSQVGNNRDASSLELSFILSLKEADLKPENFIVLKRLGGGVEGSVTKVQLKATKVIMALKVIGEYTTSAVRTQMLQNFQIMRHCNSEYLVTIYGVFLNDSGYAVIGREYMDVGSLDSILKAFGSFRMDVLGKIAEAVLGGLIYLYKCHRIIHRNLKPTNILVNSRGQIKLCDFEMSTELTFSVAETQVGGSVTYMAPERAQGLPHTVKADVWSLGLILMELATGRYPFHRTIDIAENSLILDILSSIVSDPSPKLPMSDVFPTSLREMLDKCLMKDPNLRPSPQELYEQDAFLDSSKHTPVDLEAWAVNIANHQNKPSKYQCKPVASFGDEHSATQKSLQISIELDGNAEEKDDRVATKIFLQTLQKLTSMESLEATKRICATTPCPRCAQLLGSSAEFWQSGELKEWEVVDGVKCPLCQLINDCSPCITEDQIRKANNFSIVANRPQYMTHPILKVGSLDVFTEHILKIGAQFEDLNTGSHCAFQMAAGWMHTCITRHDNCIETAKLAVPVLPTRVIDLGLSNQLEVVRLHSGGTERGLYFTLSYRWGYDNGAPFQTVRSNLEAYKISIPPLTLPQTIQDAIHITRKFGIRYLWVDALCIIQDSEEDWQAEAKQMANIYKNSLMTIAVAVDVTAEHRGCFRPRLRQHTRPFNSGIPWSDGSARYIFADRRATKDGARPPSALDTRAWVLQEQLLSPRVLSYSNQELYWDCISLNASETFPDGIPGFYDADMKSLDLRLFKKVIIGCTETTSRESLYTSWKKVAEHFTEREMTKETDKIVALLGMAKEAAAVLEDEFLVGLWKSRLWRDLLWWVKNPERCVRLQTFTAPSWTWASVNGPISYKLLGRDSDDELDQCAEIIRVEVESNQTVSAFTGKIVVRGKLVPMMPQRPQSPSESTSAVNASPPIWREDIEGMHSASGKCLVVAVSNHYVYALGLVALNEAEQLYRRIGTVNWRANPSEFGWDKRYHKWKGEESLSTIVVI